MRLWSLHPCYLDAKGLVALWREALLAKKALAGQTRGYQKHPQLIRFREHTSSSQAISYYLSEIWREGRRRGYWFDRRKFRRPAVITRIRVNRGQLQHELRWLRGKLRRRCPRELARLPGSGRIRPHPLFRVTAGPVEAWEKSTQAF
jgi:hypothetical protein